MCISWDGDFETDQSWQLVLLLDHCLANSFLKLYGKLRFLFFLIQNCSCFFHCWECRHFVPCSQHTHHFCLWLRVDDALFYIVVIAVVLDDVVVVFSVVVVLDSTFPVLLTS